MKPIIGITAGPDINSDIFLRSQYCKAVRAAGGEPVILPFIGDPLTASKICDGIIFSGGGDITEKFAAYDRFEEELLFEPSRERDSYELELARLAYENDIPTLGICRGIQVLNTALGGTMHFDIPGHRQTVPRNEPHHRVSIAKNSLLSRLMGTELLEVNSFHHQAVDAVGNGLVVSATAKGGIIEAVEATAKRFFMGVQWHPEHMICDVARALFVRLCRAATIG